MKEYKHWQVIGGKVVRWDGSENGPSDCIAIYAITRLQLDHYGLSIYIAGQTDAKGRDFSSSEHDNARTLTREAYEELIEIMAGA